MPKKEDAVVRPFPRGGGHAAVRALHVPSDDPAVVRIEVEGWEADGDGAVPEGALEAPLLQVLISAELLAAGAFDVETAVEDARKKQAGQVANLVKARSDLARVPKGPGVRGDERRQHPVLLPGASPGANHQPGMEKK